MPTTPWGEYEMRLRLSYEVVFPVKGFCFLKERILYAVFTIFIFVSSPILCSSPLRALKEANAFMEENAALPIARQVSAYLDSQREDPTNDEDGALERELDKSLPPFQPSGS